MLAIACAVAATNAAGGYAVMLLLVSGFFATLSGVHCRERLMRPQQTRWPWILLVSGLISLLPTAICVALVAL